MGPERTLPSQGEELGEPQDHQGDWIGGEEEEEEVDDQNGYQYQPLNQEPEDVTLAESDIQDRLQAMQLHLPAPPVDSDDDDYDERGASSSSIPMDADHVELVKKTMAAVKLPSFSIPLWAQKISDADWDHLVHQTIESRSAGSAPNKK
uniref:Male-enhanced antigen 1 n=1 Tax=Leptobrachium leishanense TaxID=445787 RepID=A0A8C5MYN1_9ANUR